MSAVEIPVCSQTLPALGSHCHSVEWSEDTMLRRAGLRMFLCPLGPAAWMAQCRHRSCNRGSRKGFSTRLLWCKAAQKTGNAHLDSPFN